MNQQRNEHYIPPVEHLTRLFGNCTFAATNTTQQQAHSNEKDNNNKNFASGFQQPKFPDKELQFSPPWETKIGQLQQVVRVLHRNAQSFVQNRGSVIVRCYPNKSTSYMEYVYGLVRATVDTINQFGTTLHIAADVSAILLDVDGNGVCTPIQHPPEPISILPFNIPARLTDVVLLRVRLYNSERAHCFIDIFNHDVGRVFDRCRIRSPFAHPDSTRPERLLRNRLQQVCRVKNGGRFRSKPPTHGRNEQFSYSYYRNLCQSGERYFHNNIQVYKEYPSRRTEPVPFEPFSELQYLHVVVASLRKYAPQFLQKECSVIIQNVDCDNGSTEADVERITTLVYNIVTSQQFVERYQTLLTRNFNHLAERQAASNSFLPVRIERVLRRGQQHQQSSQKQQQFKQGSGGGDGGGGGGKTNNNNNNRPPLIRTIFRNKIAAQAFCQLFKGYQQRLVENETEEESGNEEKDDDDDGEGGGSGGSSLESFSDLSDFEVFCEEGIEGEEGEGEGKDSLPRPKEEKKTKKKKSSDAKDKHKSEGREKKQPPKLLLFPNAFAHRDLTPPELALGYALRTFCRTQNGMAFAAAANSALNSSVGGGGDQRKSAEHFYVRGGRVFERSSFSSSSSSAAAAAPPHFTIDFDH